MRHGLRLSTLPQGGDVTPIGVTEGLIVEPILLSSLNQQLLSAHTHHSPPITTVQ